MSDKDVEFKLLVSRTSVSGCSGCEKGPGHFEECQALFVKSIDQEKRQITALASTGDLDRTDEIIEPEAFKELLPVYLKNPVIITSHQHRLQTGSSSVIGNAVKAWIDKQGLWVIIEFVKGTALGDEYWLLYSQKKQRALSVGFKGHEGGYEDRDGKRVWVWTKVELLEISCVPVPANSEALSKSRRRKVDFVDSKRGERQASRILDGPEVGSLLAADKAFAEAILSGPTDDETYRQDEITMRSIEEILSPTPDFAGIITGKKQLTEFGVLVSGEL